MIKFFRKIRLNLLSAGKTGKYMKYAIGEIVLVVIGILIALSINNWNEERKNEKELIEFLKSLKQELEIDIESYAERHSEYLEINADIETSLRLIETSDKIRYKEEQIISEAFFFSKKQG